MDTAWPLQSVASLIMDNKLIYTPAYWEITYNIMFPGGYSSAHYLMTSYTIECCLLCAREQFIKEGRR